jgi:hypothetical protein
MVKENRKLKAAVALGLLDHAILGREQALELVEQMGLDGRKLRLQVIEHRPDVAKGAVINGATHVGQKFICIAADALAQWCCDELALEYRHCFGRGTQLRICCEALVKHFGEEDTRQ